MKKFSLLFSLFIIGFLSIGVGHASAAGCKITKAEFIATSSSSVSQMVPTNGGGKNGSVANFVVKSDCSQVWINKLKFQTENPVYFNNVLSIDVATDASNFKSNWPHNTATFASTAKYSSNGNEIYEANVAINGIQYNTTNFVALMSYDKINTTATISTSQIKLARIDFSDSAANKYSYCPSGCTQTSSSMPITPEMTLVGSMPDYISASYSGTKLVVGSNKIARIIMRSDPKGAVKIYQFPITLSSLTKLTTKYKITVKDSITGKIIPSSSVNLGSPGKGTQVITFNPELTITSTSYKNPMDIYLDINSISGAKGKSSLKVSFQYPANFKWVDWTGNDNVDRFGDDVQYGVSRMLQYPTTFSQIHTN